MSALIHKGLDLSSNLNASWISSIIYFGAILAVLPSLFIMQKVPTAKWISFNCAVWGIILMSSSASKSFGLDAHSYYSLRSDENLLAEVLLLRASFSDYSKASSSQALES